MYEHVYTSTQLKTNLREIKDIAEHEMVYITENGVISYFFCSLDIYNDLMEKVKREASWKMHVETSLQWAHEDQAEERTTDVGDQVAASRTFLDFVDYAGFSPEQPPLSQAIEYVSQDPKTGLLISDEVDTTATDTPDIYKYYCHGYDIIYEYDSASGTTLLCGFAQSLDHFEFEY